MLETAPCPHCAERVTIPEYLFVTDDDQVIDACHWCEKQFTVARKTVAYEYTLSKD
jgi:endogenous inhibitor of DNA gyrase (YacG/DUF329 family)